MQIAAIINILGTLLTIFSLSMVPPLVVNAIYHENCIFPFLTSLLVTLFAGVLCKLFFKKGELKPRDGFLVVVLFWVVLSFFSALPFFFAVETHLSFTDALFEAVSGITTTGASILTRLTNLPHAILFYRQELQFLGGMGIIVLALAVLPLLGIGGTQLYHAEMPGPMKDEKLTPRLTETAKTLWYIYVGLALICAFCYWFAGMDLFDAICESFATLSTGGFSIHEESFTYFHSTSINIIAIVFMFAGSISFGLHFLGLQSRSLRPYFRDVECKTYVIFVLITASIIFILLAIVMHEKITFDHFITDLFNVVSVISTTGFTANQFSQWPLGLPIFMMLMGIVGGCAASTSGGIKVIRFMMMYKQSVREIKRLIHPNAVIPIKIGKYVLQDHVMETIWGFLSLFILVYVVLLLLLLALGVEFVTAFAALSSCISNVGAGIAGVADNYSQLNASCKWILTLAMLAGRLEVFSVFVLFSPVYWRS